MDDVGGELIRTQEEQLRFDFTESYKTWVHANIFFSESYNKKYSGYLTRNLFYNLEKAWNEYCLARDAWVR